MLIAARTGVWTKSGYTAKDYVQDGLIAMWDGIENAGWGVHDPNATVWKDLVGGYDLTVPPSLAWMDSCLSFDGQYSAYNLEIPHSKIGIVWTCECVYVIKEQGTNYKGLFGGRLNTGGGGWLQVYGLNYWTNMNGGWSMGNGASNDITISGNPSLANLIILNKTNYLVLGQKNDKELIAGTDGVISVEKQITRVVDTTHKGFMLGRGYEHPLDLSQQRSLKSDIHTFRLYNRTLSASEIAANYEIDKARFNLP